MQLVLLEHSCKQTQAGNASSQQHASGLPKYVRQLAWLRYRYLLYHFASQPIFTQSPFPVNVWFCSWLGLHATFRSFWWTCWNSLQALHAWFYISVVRNFRGPWWFCTITHGLWLPGLILVMLNLWGYPWAGWGSFNWNKMWYLSHFTIMESTRQLGFSK